MTGALIAGCILGLGLFLFGFALVPRRPSLSRRVQAFDSARSAAGQVIVADQAGGESAFSRRLGSLLARFFAEQGWEFRPLRSKLALVDKSFESYLATKTLLAIFGLILPPLIILLAGLAGISVPFFVPLWAALVLAGVFFLLPDLELRQEVAKRRRDFRHAVGSFLDLVVMNLSGGRGVPEALMSASEIGTGWAMWRIREALVNARITGHTPWQALGALGEHVQVDELRDLAAALSLVAEDGAKVRESLATRATSLRRRELADQQGEAGERSQSMLVAQMLLCLAFLIFLMYPAVRTLLGF